SQPPGGRYLLGTDQLGRDVLSRVIYGARISLAVGLLAVGLGASAGVAVGIVSGYAGGWFDHLLMRVVDILLAFPLYLLALTVMAILGSSLGNTILAVGIASFPAFARLTRGEALAIKRREFVDAARAIGASDPAIMRRHIFPNIVAPIIVMATLRVGQAILVEAGLSFLGLGIAPPTPSWGLMVNDGLALIWNAPWVATFPGLAIMLLVLGFNLVGDGLRDALDPRLRTDAAGPAARVA
ncbi:MAG: ABC transporter permease, partial [Armatimonadetes bacterium]|nr:ABC transporter permease [Armatimonadota bacterium]